MPAHQLQQLFADRQAQACSAIAPRHRGAALDEGIEQGGLDLRADAGTGVRDGEAHGLVGAFDLDPQMSGVGELDRVAHQVQQHLAQAGRVALDAGRHVGQDVDDHLEILFAGTRRHHLRHVLDHVGQYEIQRFELHLAGFDLREIQQVVDHRQQAVGRPVYDRGHAALLAVEVRLQQQFGHCRHAVHRRADLVAHHGQEVGFGAAAGLGLQAGRGQFVDQALIVEAQADRLGQDALGVAARQRDHQDVDGGHRRQQLIFAKARQAAGNDEAGHHRHGVAHHRREIGRQAGQRGGGQAGQDGGDEQGMDGIFGREGEDAEDHPHHAGGGQAGRQDHAPAPGFLALPLPAAIGDDAPIAHAHGGDIDRQPDPYPMTGRVLHAEAGEQRDNAAQQIGGRHVASQGRNLLGMYLLFERHGAICHPNPRSRRPGHFV